MYEEKAFGHHGKNTQYGGQEDGEPHVWLVQGVSCSAWERLIKWALKTHRVDRMIGCGWDEVVPTNERKRRGEDQVHAVAVHGEGDGEIHRQTSPKEEMIHCCPVVRVQTQLKHTSTCSLDTRVLLWTLLLNKLV